MRIILLIALLSFAFIGFAQTPKIIGEITSKRLQEVSGMAQYSQDDNFFWTHNDSGDGARLYLVSKSGNLVCTFTLSNTRAIDWEDMSIQTIDNQKYIVIGDIGDNKAERESLTIYRFPEPVWDQRSTSITIDSIQSMRFEYAEGPRDAETLMSIPNSNEIIVLSKRGETNKIYKFPFEDKASIVVSNLGEVPIKMLTSGDISEDGSILIKNYNNIYLFPSQEDQDIIKTLKGGWTSVEYVPEPQGESITWDNDGKTFYTTSEKRFAASRQFIIEYCLDNSLK